MSIKLDTLDEHVIQALVQEYNITKRERSALEVKVNSLKEKIINFYDEHTEYEGQIIDSGDDYDVVVVDQSRTTLFSKKQFQEKYGSEWIKDHMKTTFHRRLSVPKKK